MAACTHAVATASSSNTTSYASGAFTPAGNDLLVAYVIARGTLATGSMTDSQSLGMTLATSWSDGNDTQYVFISNDFAAASSMTVTFDCTGDASTGTILFVTRVSGMSRKGASALRSYGFLFDLAAVTPVASFTTGGPALTGNPTLAYIQNNSNPAAMTPPTGWTEHSDTGFAGPATGGEYATRDSGFTGSAITWGSNSATNWIAGAIELDASAPGSLLWCPGPPIRHLMTR